MGDHTVCSGLEEGDKKQVVDETTTSDKTGSRRNHQLRFSAYVPNVYWREQTIGEREVLEGTNQVLQIILAVCLIVSILKQMAFFKQPLHILYRIVYSIHADIKKKSNSKA